MSDVKKVFKFELSKFIKNKIFLGIILMVMLCYLALTSVLFFRAESQQIGEYEPTSSEHYQQCIDNAKETLQTPGNYNVKSVQQVIMKYQYYLDTNTVHTDYIEFSQRTVKTYGYEGTNYMLSLIDSCFVPFMFIMVVFACYIFGQDFSSQSIKNILLSGVRRESVLLGKIIFFLTILFSLFFALFIYGLAFGLINPSAKIFMASLTKVGSASCILYYIIECLGVLFLTLFLSAVSLYFCVKTDNTILSAVVSISAYILIYLLCYVNQTMIISPTPFCEFSQVMSYGFIPIIGIRFFNFLYCWVFLIMVFIHSIAILVLFNRTFRYLKVKDIK